MKEVALIGFGGPVFATTLTGLLEQGLTVRVLITTSPEHVMLDDTRVTVQHVDLADRLDLLQQLQGYDEVILALETDYMNDEVNTLVLKYYNEIINTAIEANVRRFVVVGGKFSKEFYTLDLRRRDNFDWVFISTEGDYGKFVCEQTLSPTVHAAVYA